VAVIFAAILAVAMLTAMTRNRKKTWRLFHRESDDAGRIIRYLADNGVFH